MVPDIERIIESIVRRDQDSVQLLLNSYNTQYAECFFFNTEEQERRKQQQLEEFRKKKFRDCAPASDSDIDSDDENAELLLRQDLSAALLCFIGSQLQPAVLRVSLHTLRILSRDRRALGHMVTDSALLTLAHMGGIAIPQTCLQQENKEAEDQVGRSCSTTHIRAERGVSVLTKALEQCLAVRWGVEYEVLTDSTQPPISMEVSQKVIEILKTLFNITHMFHRQEPDEEDAALYRHLVAVLRHCLLLSCEGEDTLEELQGHTVNVLSALPLTCLDVLVSVQVDQASHKCEGVNMDCVHNLLLFMNRRLNRGQKLKEKLTPVLNLLTESSRVHRETRHYLRQKILPPLRDVAIRPEQDSSLRGQLVRLMTHVDTDVKDCAAELLFVLCKENVSRFVKYTGYGNAAGLLAARGLLNGRMSSSNSQYSSDSDSDTEEYREAKAKINLVTGRVEADQPDPMEGMTDEEKEEEARHLISMINRLSRDQIIQPMGVTAEGRLAPLWGQMSDCTLEEEEEEELNLMPEGGKDSQME